MTRSDYSAKMNTSTTCHTGNEYDSDTKPRARLLSHWGHQRSQWRSWRLQVSLAIPVARLNSIDRKGNYFASKCNARKGSPTNVWMPSASPLHLKKVAQPLRISTNN